MYENLRQNPALPTPVPTFEETVAPSIDVEISTFSTTKLSIEVVQGMVFKRQVEGDVTRKDNAKIAVYTCAVDIIQTETKGTVLIKTADELMKFSRGEESLLESQIKAIADSGATVIVSGGKFGDMTLHYMNKYNIMAVRIPSKFDIRRLCKTVGATALPKLVNFPTMIISLM